MTEPMAYGIAQAVTWIMGGHTVSRKGWRGIGQFIYFVAAHDSFVSGDDETTKNLIGIYPEFASIHCDAEIRMRYSNGHFGPYTPTPEDLLATDWNLLP